jgi:hypothetical protein
VNEDDRRQFAFTRLIEEAEAAQEAELDAHRTLVQQWFDVLGPDQKKRLGEWMERKEWLTCEALSAAASDWYRSQPDQVAVREMIAGLEAAARQLKARG